MSAIAGRSRSRTWWGRRFVFAICGATAAGMLVLLPSVQVDRVQSKLARSDSAAAQAAVNSLELSPKERFAMEDQARRLDARQN